MSKRQRVESPTGIYHVMHRGNNKEPIFEEDYLKRKVCGYIKESAKEHSIEIYAYCIMNNHLHILVRAEIKGLSAFVHGFATQFAGYYNWRYNHVGHVFQGRFHSECIDTERYFWACLRYIHLNPVKAGIVNATRQYPYSSAVEYFSGKGRMLHSRAFQLVRNRFTATSKFLKMHEEVTTHIFLDLEEDKIPYYLECVAYFIKAVCEKYSLESDRIVCDTPKFRNEVKRQMRDQLKLSRDKANVIFGQVISGKGQPDSENDPAPNKELV